jgi:hypothetical protein
LPSVGTLDPLLLTKAIIRKLTTIITMMTIIMILYRQSLLSQAVVVVARVDSVMEPR